MKRCARKGCPHLLSHLRSDAKWCSPACAQRVRRGDSPYRNPTPRSGSSGLQVSYAKALDAIHGALLDEADFAGHPDSSLDDIYAVVKCALTESLPARQRQRLEARQGFTKGPGCDEEAGW